MGNSEVNTQSEHGLAESAAAAAASLRKYNDDGTMICHSLSKN
jgi:hypothetical protein